jgi:hypothetical protein
MMKGQAEASDYTNLVEIRSKFQHVAGHQEKPKLVETQDESKCKNETKASVKMG